MLPRQRLWAASSAGYSFLISEEQIEGDPLWSGFTASWKNLRADMLPFGAQPANMIDGGPWQSFIAAAQACDAMLKQLNRKN